MHSYVNKKILKENFLSLQTHTHDVVCERTAKHLSRLNKYVYIINPFDPDGTYMYQKKVDLFESRFERVKKSG